MSALCARATRSIAGSRRSGIRPARRRTSFTASCRASSRAAKAASPPGSAARAIGPSRTSVAHRASRKTRAWKGVRGTAARSAGRARFVEQLAAHQLAARVVRAGVDEAVAVGVLLERGGAALVVVVRDALGPAVAVGVLGAAHEAPGRVVVD